MTNERQTLLTETHLFKPFKYNWAYDAWLLQQKMHWLPEEVPLADDVVDWNMNITASQKNLLTQIFRFFTQSDLEVANCYNRNYARVFRPPEVMMMLTAFSNQESIHTVAYSHLLDTVGMPEVEYSAFMQYKAMKDKFDFMQGFDVKSHRNLALTLAAFGAFTEGVALFASFAILLSFPKNGLMRGMGQMIAWSVRDESLHCENIIRLFRTLLQEYPGIDTPDLREEIRGICRAAVEHEDAFIDLAFEQGDVPDLTPALVKRYIRFVADRRLRQLGMGPEYGIEEHPLPWVDEMVTAVEHANFFENKGTAYSKASSTGSWEEVWAARGTEAMLYGPGGAGE